MSLYHGIFKCHDDEPHTMDNAKSVGILVHRNVFPDKNGDLKTYLPDDPITESPSPVRYSKL